MIQRKQLSGWLLVFLGVLQILNYTGCAPRFLLKTPENAAAYPYISVTAEELAGYKSLLAANPKDPEAVKAHFWIAQDEFNRQDWAQADKEFMTIFKRYPKSEWAPVAGLMAARARAKQKNGYSALVLLNPLLTHPQPAVAEAAKVLSREIINDELDIPDLARVRTAYPDTAWSQQALFVTGKRTLDAGNPDQAARVFNQFLNLYPQSEFAAVAQELMVKAGRLVPINRNRIGCLIPLTGMYAPYGKAIYQGLELALTQINRGRSELEQLGLTPADSEATTQGAVAALQRLAEGDKVFAVIGPALSNSARSLLPELSRWQVPVITPSASDPGLAGQSPYFFRYLLTNEQQGEAMAEYAVVQKGFRRIGILNSDERYDRSLAAAFENKVRQLGGEVVAHPEYASGSTDFKDQMLALGGVNPGRMKKVELEERKALDRLVDQMAYDTAMQLSPQAVIAAQTPVVDPKATPIPSRRVAIVRFAETGEQAQKEQLGKHVTERFSYSLAAKPGLEVLTQRQTLEAIRSLNLNLSSPTTSTAQWQDLGRELHVQALLLGSVTQKESKSPVATPTPTPGEPFPIVYKIELRLVDVRSGKELDRYSQEWTKVLPPTMNTKQIDAIYLPVSVEDALLIAPQFAFYDLQAAVFGADAWVSPKLLREGAETLDGAVLATGFWPDDPNPQTQDFIKQYGEAYSEPPSLLAVQAYDTLKLVADIISHLGRTDSRDDFVHALQQKRDYVGITGKAWVEPSGDIRREPIFLKLESGKLKRIN